MTDGAVHGTADTEGESGSTILSMGVSTLLPRGLRSRSGCDPSGCASPSRTRLDHRRNPEQGRSNGEEAQEQPSGEDRDRYRCHDPRRPDGAGARAEPAPAPLRFCLNRFGASSARAASRTAVSHAFALPSGARAAPYSLERAERRDERRSSSRSSVRTSVTAGILRSPQFGRTISFVHS